MTNIKALILNASLKNSDEPSHTEALSKEVQAIFQQHQVKSEIVGLADYHISYGISSDMEGGRDNEFTKKHVQMLTYNTMHLAKMF
ncbi:hypothetical protein [Bacillus sp. 37MA]|uniref:hypothetical protein n=1 Tax=Bacillus sp. 37MA TaxID=1132442 RepID=UPI000366C1FB|nr:hypothetical protein [Bacillus sp. 37MA]